MNVQWTSPFHKSSSCSLLWPRFQAKTESSSASWNRSLAVAVTLIVEQCRHRVSRQNSAAESHAISAGRGGTRRGLHRSLP